MKKKKKNSRKMRLRFYFFIFFRFFLFWWTGPHASGPESIMMTETPFFFFPDVFLFCVRSCGRVVFLRCKSKRRWLIARFLCSVERHEIPWIRKDGMKEQLSRCFTLCPLEHLWTNIPMIVSVPARNKAFLKILQSPWKPNLSPKSRHHGEATEGRDLIW